MACVKRLGARQDIFAIRSHRNPVQINYAFSTSVLRKCEEHGSRVSSKLREEKSGQDEIVFVKARLGETGKMEEVVSESTFPNDVDRVSVIAQQDEPRTFETGLEEHDIDVNPLAEKDKQLDSRPKTLSEHHEESSLASGSGISEKSSMADGHSAEDAVREKLYKEVGAVDYSYFQRVIDAAQVGRARSLTLVHK